MLVQRLKSLSRVIDMENEKKYLIMIKNKNNIVETEYFYYKSSVLLTNSIIEGKINIEDEDYFKDDMYYLGKVIFYKANNSLHFYDCFNELEGNLLLNKGITEDKFVFISRFGGIELYCLLDKYYYKEKNSIDNNGKYFSRLTVIYGNTIDQRKLEISDCSKQSLLDSDLIDSLRSLYEKSKLYALKKMCRFNNLNIDLNIKFVNRDNYDHNKDEECTICLEKLGKKHVKLCCGHRYHISCLDNLIEFDNERNQNNTRNILEINCPLCREKKNIINRINILDSNIPVFRDGKLIFDFLPIKNGMKSKKNIQLNDFLGNTCFKMLKIDDNAFSLEYSDKNVSKMNWKISKILSIINIVS